jgi:probable HAF family extracellular repeat protein
MPRRIGLLLSGWIVAVALVSFSSAQSYKLLEIPSLGGGSRGSAINDNGQVVGFSALALKGSAASTSQAFLWTEGNGTQNLGSLVAGGAERRACGKRPWPGGGRVTVGAGQQHARIPMDTERRDARPGNARRSDQRGDGN